MKKYEFKNYVTHKSAEVLTDIQSWPGYSFVMHYINGQPDYALRGTGGTGEKRFTTEEAAIRCAVRYVTKEDK